MTGQDVAPATFRLGYVPGVTPAKWARTWSERLPRVPLHLIQVPASEAARLVLDGDADAVLLRLPTDQAGLHAIPLYVETTVVVVPKDHVVTAADEVTAADLADELMLHPLDDTLDWEHPPGRRVDHRPATTADAVELVAAGTGLLVVPQSLARLHHRRDLTYRPIVDVPESRVALSWPEDGTTELTEQFIGIVRGRTVNSTRGPTGARPAVRKKQPPRSGTSGTSKRGRPRRRS